MRVVVTGALGHIGSRLIRDLPGAFPGVEILLIDNLSTQRYTSLFNLPKEGRYRFVEADILDIDLCDMFAGADIVVHLAAITDAMSSFGNAARVEEVNLRGTEKVARACVKTGSALVFPSTTSVYGTQAGLVDENCPESGLRPQSPYADSKLAAEKLLLKISSESPLSFASCRFGTIFGVSPGMRFHTAVNKFCWQAAMGQALAVWKTALDQKRPYLDLSDASAFICFAIRRKLFDGRLYNVLTVNATVQDIIDTIAEGVPDLKVELVDSPIMNQLSYEVSSERVRESGFRLVGNLERGIRDTLRTLEGVHSSRTD